ncbi:MAG: formate--tetrahydrofolate ligase, partial [Oscillospiraceae bacterium]
KDVSFSPAAQKQLAELNDNGFGKLAVCIAKTQYSFSDDAKLLAAPEGFTMTVRSLRLSAGAGFVVAVMGDIMTMPGLGKKPAAENIDIDANGKISGLF